MDQLGADSDFVQHKQDMWEWRAPRSAWNSRWQPSKQIRLFKGSLDRSLVYRFGIRTQIGPSVSIKVPLCSSGEAPQFQNRHRMRVAPEKRILKLVRRRKPHFQTPGRPPSGVPSGQSSAGSDRTVTAIAGRADSQLAPSARARNSSVARARESKISDGHKSLPAQRRIPRGEVQVLRKVTFR